MVSVETPCSCLNFLHVSVLYLCVTACCGMHNSMFKPQGVFSALAPLYLIIRGLGFVRCTVHCCNLIEEMLFLLNNMVIIINSGCMTYLSIYLSIYLSRCIGQVWIQQRVVRGNSVLVSPYTEQALFLERKKIRGGKNPLESMAAVLCSGQFTPSLCYHDLSAFIVHSSQPLSYPPLRPLLLPNVSLPFFDIWFFFIFSFVLSSPSASDIDRLHSCIVLLCARAHMDLSSVWTQCAGIPHFVLVIYDCLSFHPSPLSLPIWHFFFFFFLV